MSENIFNDKWLEQCCPNLVRQIEEASAAGARTACGDAASAPPREIRGTARREDCVPCLECRAPLYRAEDQPGIEWIYLCADCCERLGASGQGSVARAFNHGVARGTLRSQVALQAQLDERQRAVEHWFAQAEQLRAQVTRERDYVNHLLTEYAALSRRFLRVARQRKLLAVSTIVCAALYLLALIF